MYVFQRINDKDLFQYIIIIVNLVFEVQIRQRLHITCCLVDTGQHARLLLLQKDILLSVKLWITQLLFYIELQLMCSKHESCLKLHNPYHLKVWFYKVRLESPKIVISKQVHPNQKVIYFIHFDYSKQVNVCSSTPINFNLHFYSAKYFRATFLPIFVSKLV